MFSVDKKEESHDVSFDHGDNFIMFYYWYNPSSPTDSKGYFRAFHGGKKKIFDFEEERRMSEGKTQALDKFLTVLTPNLPNLVKG